MEQKLAARKKDTQPDGPEPERKIVSIFQFSIRKQADEPEEYRLTFIYVMSDDSLQLNEEDLDAKKTKAYLQIKGWSDYLPKATGRTIDVIRNGDLIKLYKRKELI